MSATPFATVDSKFTKERSGLVRISPVFIIPGPAENGGAEPYELLENWSPDVKPLQLPEVDRDAVKQSDGDWALTINFEGAVGDRALNPTLEYDIAKVEDPIETFERFEALSQKYKGKIVTDDDGGVEFKGFAFKIKDPASGKQIKNPYFGVTHFRNNNPSLTVEFGLKEFRSDLLRNMCKIVTPEVPSGAAEAIETPDGMSWLKTALTANFRGNVWLIRVTYELGRWGTEIYAANVA